MKGQLTFDAEGQEGGKWHSRTLHVPSRNSGVTLGRGYDMKMKPSHTIMADLAGVGVGVDTAILLSKASGLRGQKAKDFIAYNDLSDFEISISGQLQLFSVVYNRLEHDVIRICNKQDVVRRYGVTDWDNLHDKIKDMLVDLRFRGDYTPFSRRMLQKFVAENDLAKFAAVILNTANWRSVPADRVRRRKEYIIAKEIT